MGRPKHTSGAASGWTLHDLSTFTETDSLTMKDGTTSLGTSSTVVVGAVTGESDAGLDSWTLDKVLKSSITWADYRSLEIEIVLTPPADGAGANGYLLAGIIKASGALVTQEGYLCGLRVLSAGGHRLIEKRIGANPGAGSTPNLAGAVTLMISIPFETNQPAQIVAIADDGTNIHHKEEALDVAGSPWTDCVLCLSMEKDAAGAGTMSWTVTSVKTQLLERAG